MKSVIILGYYKAVYRLKPFYNFLAAVVKALNSIVID